MNGDDQSRFEDLKFRKINQDKIADLKEYINHQCRDNIDIFVGTDSNVGTTQITFVTAICFYRKNRGCHVIYTKYTLNDKKIPLDQRLWQEVEMTKTIAEKIKKYINKDIKIYIDLDLNPNKIYDSNRIYAPAMGYLSSLGYEVRGKGNLIPAIYAANFLCQNK